MAVYHCSSTLCSVWHKLRTFMQWVYSFVCCPSIGRILTQTVGDSFYSPGVWKSAKFWWITGGLVQFLISKAHLDNSYFSSKQMSYFHLAIQIFSSSELYCFNLGDTAASLRIAKPRHNLEWLVLEMLNLPMWSSDSAVCWPLILPQRLYQVRNFTLPSFFFWEIHSLIVWLYIVEQKCMCREEGRGEERESILREKEEKGTKILLTFSEKTYLSCITRV